MCNSTSYVKAFESYCLTDKLRVITSGYVTKMAIPPFDPPWSKSPCYTL